MKAVLGLVGLLVVLGAVYALAFLQIIPAQKMAEKSPSMMKIFQPLHLAKPKPKAKLVAKGAPAPIDPAKQALDAQQAKLDADRAQLEKEKLAFAAQKAAPIAGPNGASAEPPVDPKQKRLNIYATMSADDIATIFGKQPDKVVLTDLLALDEKKAGQILAALPADRAAKLTQLMNALPSGASPSTTAQASMAPAPATASSGAAPHPKAFL